MARLARSRFRKVEVQRENPISWIGSQQFALWNENELHDDAIMANLMIEFADGVAQ
jgi:hypothetical protein